MKQAQQAPAGVAPRQAQQAPEGVATQQAQQAPRGVVMQQAQQAQKVTAPAGVVMQQAQRAQRAPTEAGAPKPPAVVSPVVPKKEEQLSLPEQAAMPPAIFKKEEQKPAGEVKKQEIAASHSSLQQSLPMHALPVLPQHSAAASLTMQNDAQAGASQAEQQGHRNDSEQQGLPQQQSQEAADDSQASSAAPDPEHVQQGVSFTFGSEQYARWRSPPFKHPKYDVDVPAVDH
jgi:hypothetical protein